MVHPKKYRRGIFKIGSLTRIIVVCFMREYDVLVHILYACPNNAPSSTVVGLVNHVRGNAKWIQHGTVLAG